MQIFTRLLFLSGLYLVHCNSNNHEIKCKPHDCYNICKKNTVLISVNVSSDTKLICSDTLFIYDKEISTINKNAFKNLPIVALTINTASKKLDLDKESFNGLSYLKTLEIYNGIVTLKKNLFKSVYNLTSLSLRIDGRQQNFDDKLNEISKLKRLIISHSHLTKINDETFKNSNVEITDLILSYNSIQSITQTAFNLFKNLNFLQFNSNHLTSIEPYTFANLKQLKRLKISDEKINSFPNIVFNGLEKLQMLEIVQNPNFENLASLDLHGFTELSYLNLRLNSITKIPQNILNKAKKLKEIDLTQNKIDKIEKESFSGLDLINLNLANNNLRIIENGVFDNLNVRELDLSDNNITKIEKNSFINTSITKLFLYNNNVHVDKIAWGLFPTTEVFTGGMRHSPHLRQFNQ